MHGHVLNGGWPVRSALGGKAEPANDFETFYKSV